MSRRSSALAGEPVAGSVVVSRRELASTRVSMTRFSSSPVRPAMAWASGRIGLRELVRGQIVFAWSGGGMVIGERLVLFHDFPPQGRGAAELFDEGLGLVPDVVALPQPETRLRLHDGERVSLLARRFAPAACLALPAGTHAILRDGQLVAASGVSHLLPEGACKLLEERIA